MNAVNALNAIHGQLLLFLLTLTAMLLMYSRYRKIEPIGPAHLIDALNTIHPAVYGFVICMMGIALEMTGHSQAGDKVFLSGASFIGGVAARSILPGRPATNTVTSPVTIPND